jgi:hypothetical protein
VAEVAGGPPSLRALLLDQLALVQADRRLPQRAIEGIPTLLMETPIPASSAEGACHLQSPPYT